MELKGIMPGSIFKYKDHPKVKDSLKGKHVVVTADDMLYLETTLKQGEELVIEPVHLTTELLVKNCGYQKETDEHGGYLSPMVNNEFGIRLTVDSSGGFTFLDYPPMYHLHQLQILHLALTGEEMSVSL